MKRFLIVILFSLFFPIQNSSAVSPSLDETLEFLVNGENGYKTEWSINDDCILELNQKEMKQKAKIYLNKVNLTKGVESVKMGGKEIGFMLSGKGMRLEDMFDDGVEKLSTYDHWSHRNSVSSTRNIKALSHLFSNFCTGVKSAF